MVSLSGDVHLAPVITIFVRHAEGCKYAGDETEKRCNCRKHLRWTVNGKQYRKQAGTRSWSEAEEVKRRITDQLAGRTVVADAESDVKSLDDCIAVFIQDKKTEGIAADGIARYTRELGRLRAYAERWWGVYTIKGVTRELLSGYCATWADIYPSTGTRVLTAKLIKCFLRYCSEAKWLDRIPALPKIKSEETPTMPLTPEEYSKLLEVVAEAPKLRALIQLMRWSGLAIRDASTIARSCFKKDDRGFYRVVTARQKTGTHVSVPMPIAIAEEILSVKNSNPDFIFWHGVGSGQNFSIGYGAKISGAMDKAGLAEACFMKSHRLRDTFAVDLLQKGVPLEEVSKLLGHESIRTTEKHYAKWVKGRQDRLDSLVVGTWAGSV